MVENQSEKAQEKAITKEANAIVSTLKEDGKITGPLTPEIEARARKLAEGLKDGEKQKVLAKLDLLKTDVQKTKMDGIKKILKEGNDDISPDELERAIMLSEENIKAVPSVDLQNTLRGVHGAIIADSLRSQGHNLHIKNEQIVIDPKKGTVVVNLQEKLQTLVNTGKVSLDTLKVGLLYSSPTFGEYSQLKKTRDGKIDPKVDSNDFNRYLRDLSKDQQAAPDVKSLIESRDMLSGINMQQAILSYKDMEQVGTWIQAHPEVQQSVTTAVVDSSSVNPAPQSAPSSHAITETPSPANNTSNTTPNPVQNGANAVTGKAGEFAGTVADNIGGFASGVSQAMSKGFEKGGAVGGLAVAIIGIMGAWKFLTGNYFKNKDGSGGVSGWMAALLGFGGKAAYDMASEYGLIDKTKDAAKDAVKKAKAKAEGTTDTKTSSESADVDPDKTHKSVSKTVETQNLTGSQLEATKTVENNVDLKKTLDGKTPGMSEYLNFVHKELSGVAMDKLINDTDSSIFAPGTTIDPAIKENLGTMNPITLKKVLRAYLGTSVILSISSGKQPGMIEKENFMKEKIIQKGMNADSIKTKTLAELTTTLYTSSKVESTNLSPEIINKIKSYKLAHAGKELPKDNLDISVDPEMYEDNTYGVTLTIKNPKLLNQNISSVEPIMVYFDKTGNLLTDTVAIKTNIPAKMGGEPQYSLKKNGDTIGMTTA